MLYILSTIIYYVFPGTNQTVQESTLQSENRISLDPGHIQEPKELFFIGLLDESYELYQISIITNINILLRYLKC